MENGEPAELGSRFGIKRIWDAIWKSSQEKQIKTQQAKDKGREMQQKVEDALVTHFESVPQIPTIVSDAVLDAFYNQSDYQPTREAIDESTRSIVLALKKSNPNLELIFTRYGRDPSVEDLDGEINYFEAMLTSGMALTEADVQDIRSITSISTGTPRERGKAMLGFLTSRVIQNIGNIPEVTREVATLINETFMWPHPDQVNPDVEVRDNMVSDTLERLEQSHPGFYSIVRAGASNFDSEQIASLTTQVVAAFALSGKNR